MLEAVSDGGIRGIEARKEAVMQVKFRLLGWSVTETITGPPLRWRDGRVCPQAVDSFLIFLHPLSPWFAWAGSQLCHLDPHGLGPAPGIHCHLILWHADFGLEQPCWGQGQDILF